MKITAVPNKDRTGFHIPSTFNKARLLEMLKRYKRFEITPIISESVKSRRYLEGAIIPAYCKWQYGIDPRDPEKSETRRFLFKRDFHSDIVKDRRGRPIRAPKSSKGQASAIATKYTEWAIENGAPVPNPALFKLYRDKWATDFRFPSFHDWLEFLGIEEDAMPTPQTLAKLD